MKRLPTHQTGGRPPGLPCRYQFRFKPVELEIVKDAARIYDVPLEKWVRTVLVYEAMRARIAASNVPQGLHPKAKVYRVTDAPVQGAWAYREYFDATGIERIWVTQFLDDAPKGISHDGRAVVIDVLNGAKNLVTAYDNVRWVGASPLNAHIWAQRAKEDEAKERQVVT